MSLNAINQLLRSAIDWCDSFDGETSIQESVSPNINLTRIPTLLKGHYETMSPMLLERYKLFGAWVNATHGDWLDLKQMEFLWTDLNDNNSKSTYAQSLEEASKNWENDAVRLFKPERISVFAASCDTYERIYLLWFDGLEEPEFWVYDTNGAARYQDFSAYLKAFLDDDLTSYSDHWILGYYQ